MANSRIETDETGWTFSTPGGHCTRALAPVIYGKNGAGKSFSMPLSFAGVKPKPYNDGAQDEGIVLRGSSDASCIEKDLSINWALTLLRRDPNVLIQLHLVVVGGVGSSDGSGGVGPSIEHIVLGAFEHGHHAGGGAGVEGSSIGAGISTRTSAALAAVATLSAVPFLPSPGAAAAAVLAPCAALWHRIRGVRRASAAAGSFFINGWQSFSFSGTIRSSDAQPRTSLPFFSGAFHTGATPPPSVPAVTYGTSPSAAGGGASGEVGLVSDLFGIFLSNRATAAKGGAAGGGTQGEEASEEASGEASGGGGGLLLGFVTARHGAGGVATVTHGGVERSLLLFTEQHASLRPPHGQSSVSIDTDWAMAVPIDPLAVTAAAPPSPSPSPSPVAAHLSALEAYAMYTAAVATHSAVAPERAGRADPARGVEARPTPIGWCSWYCHGPNVSESLMLGTVQRLGEARASGQLPLELVQLDDGWQVQWGDWTIPHPTRFPNGLRPLTAATEAAGMLAGLWIAPCALTSSSALMRAHPEWVLRTPSGAPLKCGWTAPGLWIYALDVTHPGAIEYVRLVVRTATREWGFKYLKLDFLHTAAMPGGVRHDPSVTRSQALYNVMAAVRAEVGNDVFVLACGAPIGPCIGHVDGMRVSADAATHWLPTGIDVPGTRWLFAHDRTNLPAARNMARNVVARLPMSGQLWRNDPDCLILRAASGFSLGQAQALATVAALSAGALIFSDPPESLAPERLAVLQKLLPPMPRAAVALDLMVREIPAQLITPLSPAAPARDCDLGEWWLCALFNWSGVSAPAGGLREGKSAADGGGLRLSTLVAAASSASSGRSAAAAAASSSPSSSSSSSLAAGQAAVNAATEGWHAFEFWSGTYQKIGGGPEATLMPAAVPARCGLLLALRPIAPAASGRAQLVGTNVHVSCGLEVALWRQGSGSGGGSRHVELQLKAGRAVDSPRVWIHLPGTSAIKDAGRAPSASGVVDVTWVADAVWVITLSPIDRAGESTLCRVEY